MKLSRRLSGAPAGGISAFFAVFLLLAGSASASGQWGHGRDPSRPAPVCEPSILDSPYIPVDSWIYPAVLRLFSLNFVDTAYLGMRPWTRSSLEHMLEEAGARI